MLTFFLLEERKILCMCSLLVKRMLKRQAKTLVSLFGMLDLGMLAINYCSRFQQVDCSRVFLFLSQNARVEYVPVVNLVNLIVFHSKLL